MRAPSSFFCTLKGQEGFDAPSEMGEGGGGLLQDPAEVLLLWSCKGWRRRGVSGGHAGEMVTKCFASPRTLGRAGWGVASGGCTASLPLSPTPHNLTFSPGVDFTAPDPELTLRHLSDGVYRLSSPEAGLLERGLWLTSHGFKMGPPTTAALTFAARGEEGQRERGGGEGQKDGYMGWAGTSCWSRGSDSVLPTQGAQVRPLVGELHLACIPHLNSHATTKKPARHK